MILTDMMLLSALFAFAVFWCLRGTWFRRNVLCLIAVTALTAGLVGAFDHRWQNMVGAVIAIVYLIFCWLGSRTVRSDTARLPWISRVVVFLLLLVAALPIYMFPVFDLPRPTGEHIVGFRDFELVDTMRTGVLGAADDEPRRLLVRVWYPAANAADIEPQPYFTDEEEDSIAIGNGQMTDVPVFWRYLKHSKTNSYPGAPLLAADIPLPVVVYSHGYAPFIGQNTALMEELASHGYLVFSVQHTFDASPTVCPDGNLLAMDFELMHDHLFHRFSDAIKNAFAGQSLVERFLGKTALRYETVEREERIDAQSMDVWLQDRAFVLDRLQFSKVPDSVREVVVTGDYRRTGQIGMSFGGSTTGGFCMVDPRCSAGVNLDGRDYHGTPYAANVPVPFLMMYADFGRRFEVLQGVKKLHLRGLNDFSYERPEAAGLRRDVVRLSVSNVHRLVNSDLTLFVRNPLRELLLGTIDPEAIISIQNDFVVGFFDTYLRNQHVNFPAAQFASHRDYVTLTPVDYVRDWWLDDHPEDAVERVILQTDLGELELALYPKRAPISVANFLAYVDAGLFDGADFYRATSFERGHGVAVVQGGLEGDFMLNPPADLSSIRSPLPPIKHETTDQTGILNEVATVAYARMAPGTASSEFFINMGDNTIANTGDTSRNPDGQGYATFGRVLRGMSVLHEIQSLPKVEETPVKFLQGQILSQRVTIRQAYRVDPE